VVLLSTRKALYLVQHFLLPPIQVLHPWLSLHLVELVLLRIILQRIMHVLAIHLHLHLHLLQLLQTMTMTISVQLHPSVVFHHSLLVLQVVLEPRLILLVQVVVEPSLIIILVQVVVEPSLIILLVQQVVNPSLNLLVVQQEVEETLQVGATLLHRHRRHLNYRFIWRWVHV
jgi:hypothetical protein